MKRENAFFVQHVPVKVILLSEHNSCGGSINQDVGTASTGSPDFAARRIRRLSSNSLEFHRLSSANSDLAQAIEAALTGRTSSIEAQAAKHAACESRRHWQQGLHTALILSIPVAESQKVGFGRASTPLLGSLAGFIIAGLISCSYASCWRLLNASWPPNSSTTTNDNFTRCEHSVAHLCVGLRALVIHAAGSFVEFRESLQSQSGARCVLLTGQW